MPECLARRFIYVCLCISALSIRARADHNNLVTPPCTLKLDYTDSHGRYKLSGELSFSNYLVTRTNTFQEPGIGHWDCATPDRVSQFSCTPWSGLVCSVTYNAYNSDPGYKQDGSYTSQNSNCYASCGDKHGPCNYCGLGLCCPGYAYSGEPGNGCISPGVIDWSAAPFRPDMVSHCVQPTYSAQEAKQIDNGHKYTTGFCPNRFFMGGDPIPTWKLSQTCNWIPYCTVSGPTTIRYEACSDQTDTVCNSHAHQLGQASVSHNTWAEIGKTATLSVTASYWPDTVEADCPNPNRCNDHPCTDTSPCSSTSPFTRWEDATCRAKVALGFKVNIVYQYQATQEVRLTGVYLPGATVGLIGWANTAQNNNIGVCSMGSSSVTGRATSQEVCLKVDSQGKWQMATLLCVDCNNCGTWNPTDAIPSCYNKDCGDINYILNDVRPGFTSVTPLHIQPLQSYTKPYSTDSFAAVRDAETLLISGTEYECLPAICHGDFSIAPPLQEWRTADANNDVTSHPAQCHNSAGFRQVQVREYTGYDSNGDVVTADPLVLLPISGSVFLPIHQSCSASNTLGDNASLSFDIGISTYTLPYSRAFTACAKYTTSSIYRYRTPDGANVVDPFATTSPTTPLNVPQGTTTQDIVEGFPSTADTPAKVHCPKLEMHATELVAVRCINGHYFGINGYGYYGHTSESSSAVYAEPPVLCANPGEFFSSLQRGQGMVYNNQEGLCRVVTDPVGMWSMFATVSSSTRTWYTNNHQYTFLPESAVGGKCDGFYDPPTVYARRFGWHTADDYDRERLLGEPQADVLLSTAIEALEPGSAYYYDSASNRFRSALPGNTIVARSLNTGWKHKYHMATAPVMQTNGRDVLNANYWAETCKLVPSTAFSIRVTMGTYIDYFRPINGSTFCDMLTSHDKHEWSANNEDWYVPTYYREHFGGSDQFYPYKYHDYIRDYLAFWGDETQQGGCCNNGTITNPKTLWGQSFSMHYTSGAMYFPFHVYVGHPTSNPILPTHTLTRNVMSTDGTDRLDVSYWQQTCQKVPHNALSVRLTMGDFTDYFRPTRGHTFCEMLTSYDKHEWSRNNVNWITENFMSYDYQTTYGSSRGVPYAMFGDNDNNVEGTHDPEWSRYYVPYWGNAVSLGGCGHTTGSQYTCENPFVMDYVAPCDLTHFTERVLNPGWGYVYNKTSGQCGQFDSSHFSAITEAWDNQTWTHDTDMAYYVPPTQAMSNAMPTNLVDNNNNTVQCDYVYTCPSETFLFRQAINFTKESERVGLVEIGRACSSSDTFETSFTASHPQECMVYCNTTRGWYGWDNVTKQCLCSDSGSCDETGRVFGIVGNTTLFQNLHLYENWSGKSPSDREKVCIPAYNKARGVPDATTSEGWRHWFDHGAHSEALAAYDPEMCMGWVGVMDTLESHPYNKTLEESCYTGYCHDNDLHLSTAAECRNHWETTGKYNEAFYAATSNPWQCILDAHPSVHRTPKTLGNNWKGIKPEVTLVSAGMWLGGRPYHQEKLVQPRLVCGNAAETEFEAYPIDCKNCTHKPTSSAVFLDTKLEPTPSPTTAPTLPPISDSSTNQCGTYHFLAGDPLTLLSTDGLGGSRQNKFTQCLHDYKAAVFGDEHSNFDSLDAVRHWASLESSTNASKTLITCMSTGTSEWGFIRGETQIITSGARRLSSVDQEAAHTTPVQWSDETNLNQFTGKISEDGTLYRCPEIKCGNQGKAQCDGATPSLTSTFCQVEPFYGSTTTSPRPPTPPPSVGGVSLVDTDVDPSDITTQSTTYYFEGVEYTSSLALNINAGHCATTETEQYAWWRVDLGSIRRIKRIVLHTNNILVQVRASTENSFSPNTAFPKCGDELTGGEVRCDVYGRYVWVSRVDGHIPGKLEVCTFEAYGGQPDMSWLSDGVVFCSTDRPILCTNVSYMVAGTVSNTLVTLDSAMGTAMYSRVNISTYSDAKRGESALTDIEGLGINCPAVYCDSTVECAQPAIGKVKLTKTNGVVPDPFTSSNAINGCNQVVCSLGCNRKLYAKINKNPYTRLSNDNTAGEPGEVLIADLPIDHTGRAASRYNLTHDYSIYSDSNTAREYTESFDCPAVKCDPFTRHPPTSTESQCGVTGLVECKESDSNTCVEPPSCSKIICQHSAKPTPAPTPGVATQHGYTVFGVPDYWGNNGANVSIPRGFDCSTSPYFNTKSAECTPGESFCHPLHSNGLSDILAPYTDCNDHEWVPGMSSVATTTVADTEQDAFDALFRSSATQILKRECPTCLDAYQQVYYKRHTLLPPYVSLYSKLLNQWENTTGNIHGVDYDIFSTIEDAASNTNAWSCESIRGQSGGFPRGCMPPLVQDTHSQWTPHKQGIFFVLKTIDRCAPGKACKFGNRDSPFVNPYGDGVMMHDRCQCESIDRELPVHVANTDRQFTRCDTGFLPDTACQEAAAVVWSQNTNVDLDALRGCEPGHATCVDTMLELVNTHSSPPPPTTQSTWGCNLVHWNWAMGFSTPDSLYLRQAPTDSVYRICPGEQPLFYPITPKFVVTPDVSTHRNRHLATCPQAISDLPGHYGYTEMATEQECREAAAVSGDEIVSNHGYCKVSTELLTAAQGGDSITCRDACAVSYECTCYSMARDHCRLFSEYTYVNNTGTVTGTVTGSVVALKGAPFRVATEAEWGQLPSGCVWVEGKTELGYPEWSLVFNSLVNYAAWNNQPVLRDPQHHERNTCHVEKNINVDANCTTSVGNEYLSGSTSCSNVMDDILPASHDSNGQAIVQRDFFWNYANLRGSSTGDVWLQIAFAGKHGETDRRVVSVTLTQIYGKTAYGERAHGQIAIQAGPLWNQVGYLGPVFRDTRYSGEFYPNVHTIHLDAPTITSHIRIVPQKHEAFYHFARVEIGGCAVDDVQLMCTRNNQPGNPGERTWMNAETWGANTAYGRSSSGIRFGRLNATDNLIYELLDRPGIGCTSGYTVVTTPTQCLDAYQSLLATGYSADLAVKENAPFDGFVHPDEVTVPGCHYDNLPGVSESWAWNSARSSTEFQTQPSTNKFRFNALTMPFRGATPTANKLRARGHDWSRGRSVCVREEYLWTEWEPLGSTNWANMPSPLTHAVVSAHNQTFDQCAQVCQNHNGCVMHSLSSNKSCTGYESFPETSSSVDNFTWAPMYMLVAEPGWGCPENWYTTITDLDQCVEAYEQISTTTKINGVTVVISPEWQEPVEFLSTSDASVYLPGCVMTSAAESGPVWSETYGFESYTRRFTFNANLTTASLSESQERLARRPLGRSVCVHKHHHKSPPIDQSSNLLGQLQDGTASPVQLVDTIERPESSVQQVTITLRSTNFAEILASDVALIQEAFAAALRGIAIGISPAQTGRRSAGELAIVVTLNTFDLGQLEQIVSAVMEQITLYASIGEIDAQFSEITVTPPTASVSDQYVLKSDVAVRPFRGGTEGEIWFHVSCNCKTSTGLCGPHRSFEIRGNSIEFHATLLDFGVAADSFDSCMEMCQSTASCALVEFYEGPTAEPDKRCRYSTSFEGVDHLVVNHTSLSVVGFKLNRCAPIMVTQQQLCDLDNPDGKLCVDLPDRHLQAAPPGPQCWALHDGETNHTTLCADGSQLEYNETTHECAAIGSQRALCPRSRPYMCALAPHEYPDRLCMPSAPLCNVSGGVLPCGSQIASTRALSLAPHTTPPPGYEIHLPEQDLSSEASNNAINSVSRCGEEFAPLGYDTPLLNHTECQTGFTCCKSVGDCVCPLVANSTHLALHGGRFADTCRAPASVWPRCIDECVRLGEACKYYMVFETTGECLLCHTGGDVATAPGWSYHSVGGIVHRNTLLVAPAKPSLRNAYTAYGHLMGRVDQADTATVPNSDWYAHHRGIVRSALISVSGDFKATVDKGDFDAAHCRTTCETAVALGDGSVCVFWSAFDDDKANFVVREEYCPSYTGCSLGAHVEGGVCDCRHPILKNGTDNRGCWRWYVHPDVIDSSDAAGGAGIAVEWVPTTGYVSGVVARERTGTDTSLQVSLCPLGYQSIDGVGSAKDQHQQCERAASALSTKELQWTECNCGCAAGVDGDVTTVYFGNHSAGTSETCSKSCSQRNSVCVQQFPHDTEPTWMRCSQRCTISVGCQFWAWNMASKQCVIFESSPGLGEHLAFFGSDWISAARAPDTVERGENVFDIKTAQLYLTALEGGVLQGKHNTMEWRARRDVTLENAPFISSVELSPSQYFGIDASNYLAGEFVSNPNEWEFSTYHGKITNRVTKTVTIDTSCWHANTTISHQHTHAAVKCDVAGAGNCGPLGNLFSGATPFGQWHEWSLGLWVYPMAATDTSREIITQSASKTLENKMPSLALNSQTNQLEVFSMVSSTMYVRSQIPLPLARHKWTHVGLVQHNGTMHVMYNLEKETSLKMTNAPMGQDDWSKILQSETSNALQGMASTTVLFASNAFSNVSGAMSAIRGLATQSPCYGTFYAGSNNTALFVNPYYGVTEALQSYNDDSFIASTQDHSMTSFEWTRSDCVSEKPLTVGQFYAFDAVYTYKIQSSIGLFEEVAKGTYVEKRLSVCHGGLYPRLCLAPATEHGSWEVTHELESGAVKLRYWDADGPTNVTMQTMLELDYTTTFPEIYNLHASHATGFRLDSGLNDIDVALSSSGEALFGGKTVACHGGCRWFVADSPEAFTLVRRFSDTSTGAIFDSADPRGVVSVVSTTFANSTETHTWIPSGCESFGNTSGMLVSLYTGRCLSMQDGAVLYQNCEAVSSASTCWTVSAATTPHEAHRGQQDTNTWRTLGFDDSRLWWHSDVIAPPLSNDSLFLTPGAITDVEFMLQLNSDAIDATSGVTPVRAYTSLGAPIKMSKCYGTKPSNPLLVYACDTPCSNTSMCTTTAVASNEDGRLVCNPSSCWSYPSSWFNVTHTRAFDAELVQTTSGVLFKRRPLNSIDAENTRRCMSALGKSTLHQRRLQTVECSESDVYRLNTLSSEALSLSGDDAARVLSSLNHPGMCVGVAATGSMELVPCTDSTHLVHVRNAHRDDADLHGRGTNTHSADRAMAVLKYGNDASSVTVLYYPKINKGQLRAVISLNATTLGVGYNPDKVPVVSLVDDTSEISGFPNLHVYTVRVHRKLVANGTQEVRQFVLKRNGTIVDSVTQDPVHYLTKPGVAAAGAWRMSVDSTVALPLDGLVTSVDTASYSDQGVAMGAVSDVRFRFGNGQKWRMHRQGYTFDMTHGLPGDCIDMCRNKTECRAARWSPYTKVCEILPTCDKIARVAEGYPNSLNLRASPWFVFDKRADKPNSGHRLVALHESEHSKDGSLKVEQTVSGSLLAASFAHVLNTEIYPDSETLIQNTGYDHTNKSQYAFEVATGYPSILARSTTESDDIICTNAHTFAFVGSFTSMEARFGYRNIFSPASEGGKGGVSLSLSPDGHLKDRLSNVSIHVEGEGGCLSVVVIDCHDGMRVSVNGQLRHTMEVCPFDLLNTDTKAHGWIGRADVLCMGGQPLNNATHFELVAHYQALYSKPPHSLCWNPSDPGSDNKYHVLPENRANLGPIHRDRWTWRVDHWGIDHSTMRCMDPALCHPATTDSVEMYKEEMEEHTASPFKIAFPGLEGPEFLNATADRVTDVNAAALFVSDVTAEDERSECGITAVHTEHLDAPPCVCDESFFSEWVEDVERSEQCGECLTDYQTGIYPQWLQGMQFQRETGVRSPDRNAVAKRYTRTLLPHRDAPCPDFYANPNKYLVNDSWLVQCPRCARDCRLQPLGMVSATQRLQDMQEQPDTHVCPETRANNIECGNRTMRRSCLFHIPVLEEPAHGGRNCLEVVLSDMQQISQANKLQKQKTATSWAPAAYYDDELTAIGRVVSAGYYMTYPVINIIVKQTAVFPDMNWQWISADAQEQLTAAGITPVHNCPSVCDATACSDTEDPNSHSRDVMYSTVNVVIVVTVVVLLFGTLAAAITYASKLRETQQAFFNYVFGNQQYRPVQKLN